MSIVRGLRLDYVTYDALKAGFQNESLIFQVPGLGSIELGEMNPASVPRKLPILSRKMIER